MADRDKVIAELCERYKDDDLDACEDFAEAIWDAARADAIEECAKKVKAQANRQNTHAHDGASCLYCELEEALRSLSRKQEKPR